MNNIRPDSGKPVWGKRSNGNKRIFMSREVCVAVNIHEFGKENKETILLIHPSVVKWDYFENVIPLLQENYHLLVPALPGYDYENDSDFTGVEQIAFELNVWMKAEGYTELYAVYGCSMGGSIALMVALKQMIGIKHYTVSVTVDRNPFYCPEGLSYDDDRKNRGRGAVRKSTCNG